MDGRLIMGVAKLMNKLLRTLTYPIPLRVLILTRLFQSRVFRNLPLFDYKTRLDFDFLARPHYGYCMYRAALQARELGYKTISVIEFGVGAGNGLLDAEYHKLCIGKLFDIELKLYGFDLGEGLPPPLDYRDMPHFWAEGQYQMDVEALKERMRHSELIIGDVRETAKSFIKDHQPPPLGAIFFDLDYYSSTKAAFSVLNATSQTRLPRIFSYFDDIIGLEFEEFHPFGGELLAINEFNEDHERIKIAREEGLARKRKIPASWNDQIFVIHDFDHPDYCKYTYPISRVSRKL